jgi:phosphoglycerate dehydrogenase-like enzyme
MAKQGFHSKSFKEGVEILADEIKLAFQWQRPSILLAVHNSKPEQIKAQQALEKELIKSNKKVKLIKAAGMTPDVISVMCKTTGHEEIVFFVSGMGNAEGLINSAVSNALNMHRELLVEQRIRVVFWLTKLEASSLPHHAPDFWAFRHRVVEFAGSRGPKKAA